MLSSGCKYGIRAALYMATREQEGYVPIREISTKLNISFHFLTKILQALTQQGIMKSFRGPTGGIALARPASQISLRDIVVALDGAEVFQVCVLGLPGCGSRRPCPLHDHWATARNEIEQMFAGMTLEEVGTRVLDQQLRFGLEEAI